MPRLGEEQGFVLGIDFGGTKIDIGTARLDGEPLESVRIATDAPSGADQAVERALAAARQLIADTAAATGSSCLAVGAVTPGVVLEDEIRLAPNVPGWGALALPSLLRRGLGTDAVAVGNDVKAAALAEVLWGVLAGADPAVFVSLGTGIAAGLVIGGRVIEGANGSAGEIGYSLRHPTDVMAFARGHAPLEEFVGGRAIGERATKLLGRPVEAAEAFETADLPAGFIDETLSELSMHLANLAIAVDPGRVAVGGGLMARADLILPALDERLRAAVPFPPEVVPARFLQDGALRGAFALALAAVPARLEVTP